MFTHGSLPIRVTAGRATAFILALGLVSAAAWADPLPLHGLDEVNHAQVELRGGFWGPRLKANGEVTVPHALDCLEKDGHVINFDKAAGVLKGPPSGHAAFDSDLHRPWKARCTPCSITATLRCASVWKGFSTTFLLRSRRTDF